MKTEEKTKGSERRTDKHRHTQRERDNINMLMAFA